VIVIDASALIEVLQNTPAYAKVSQRLFGRADTLHAPHLLDLEVAQVLRRYTLSGEMTVERSEEALEDLADLPLNRYPHDIFLRRIWALRRNLTAYDTVYLALAEALDAPLITRDTALAKVPGHRARVEVFR
jgi:predicted nucleic acid-binding protein